MKKKRSHSKRANDSLGEFFGHMSSLIGEIRSKTIMRQRHRNEWAVSGIRVKFAATENFENSVKTSIYVAWFYEGFSSAQSHRIWYHLEGESSKK